MDQKLIGKIAISVRSLTMDAVQKANSGHPGLPMGLAELGSLLYGEVLKIYPQDPAWIDRDRFVLSAGHGCMLLYALLHLAGFDISLDEIKRFRQLGSKAAGHPEYGLAPGVDTTTGPLGQGFANAVGMAIAERMLADRFNTPRHEIINHYTYVISSDGCLMEGVTSESASLAGHLGLGKLIVFYDDNRITIEGSTDLTFTEDVAGRFESYGWQTLRGDAYDIGGIFELIEQARAQSERPTLILLKSVIAKGSPNLAGSHESHGAPLGEEEVLLTKRALGIPEESDFYIDPVAVKCFQDKRAAWEKEYSSWQALFKEWSHENPELAKLWHTFFSAPDLGQVRMPAFKIGDKVATRSASGKVLNALAAGIPNLIGGSADLAPSNKTYLSAMGDVQKNSFSGRNFHFGIREHAMGALGNGIALHGGLRPFCATFFVFTDYMRPPIRLANMMRLPVIYVLTHDSFYVGEDGPTHQPVEHLAAMRVIPGMLMLRPADAQETEAAWAMALERNDGPTAIVLTRQNIEVFAKHDSHWRETIKRGAYIAKDSDGEPDIVIIATGSEVELALKSVESSGARSTRVVSMISRELFLKQKESFRQTIVPDSARRLVVEAGVACGWEGLAGKDGHILSVESFGESGPYGDVAEHFGFSIQNITGLLKKIRNNERE